MIEASCLSRIMQMSRGAHSGPVKIQTIQFSPKICCEDSFIYPKTWSSKGRDDDIWISYMKASYKKENNLWEGGIV